MQTTVSNAQILLTSTGFDPVCGSWVTEQTTLAPIAPANACDSPYRALHNHIPGGLFGSILQAIVVNVQAIQ